jgi:hypothetical protein
VNFDKIVEKDGLKNFKKLKLAKFNVLKNYQTKILEEIVEDVQRERKEEIRR